MHFYLIVDELGYEFYALGSTDQAAEYKAATNYSVTVEQNWNTVRDNHSFITILRTELKKIEDKERLND